MQQHWDNIVNWGWTTGAWTMFGISLHATKDALQVVALIVAIIASIFAAGASWSTIKRNNRQ